jgi:hypothetical protein
MFSTDEEQYARDHFGEPNVVRIVRRGERDLAFSGWEIGRSLTENEYRSAIATLEVTIYITTKGNFVTRIDRTSRSKWDEAAQPETETRGAPHSYAEDALKWLIDDHGSELGAASKTAWEQACRAWPGLAEFEVETV